MNLTDIELLVSDRQKFDSYVYTNSSLAEDLLKARWSDQNLKMKISKFLSGDIPTPLVDGNRAVLVRHVITPNHEIRRFLQIVNYFSGLKPLLAEHSYDKFVTNNEWKYSLANLSFTSGSSATAKGKTQHIQIIDLKASEKKPLSELDTLWGQNLVSFHHELFQRIDVNAELYCISDWLQHFGRSADKYYKYYLALFIRNGILFDNFLPNKGESKFTREVFLPSLIELEEEFGVKPIIVALEPTTIESDSFWLCHPQDTYEYVRAKLNK